MSSEAQFGVILAAAGRAERFGHDKLTVTLNGRSVFSRALRPFLDRTDVIAVVAVTHPQARDGLLGSLDLGERVSPRLHWCDGGPCRAASVREGLRVLEALAAPPEFIAIHDAARPAVSDELVGRVFTAAVRDGAAIPGVPVTDTIKRVADGKVAQTLRRSELVAVQTPQAMRRIWLSEAFARCPVALDEVTDDAQLLELAGYPVVVVDGAAQNLKVTTRGDIERLERLIR